MIGVLVVALAAGGIYTGLVHVKKNKVTEVPVTSVSNLLTDWYSETTLDGTITTNVSQNINMDKDMIIEKIYVSQGDDVKKGDNLISFDMTLVEMELNIAKLKLQKQEQDLTKAQNRLTSLQNGGPIEDSTDELDTSTGDTGSTGDDEMSSTDLLPAEMEMEICSLLLDQQQRIEAAVIWRCDSAIAPQRFYRCRIRFYRGYFGQMEDVQGEEVPSAGSADQESESTESGSDGLGDGLIMEPSYQDPEVDDITDGENPTENPMNLQYQLPLRRHLLWDQMNFLIPMETEQNRKFPELQTENRSFIRNWMIHRSLLQEQEQKRIHMFFL